MKLAAIVLLYNPKPSELETISSNIKTYAEHCEHIYLVDNSPNMICQEAVERLTPNNMTGGGTTYIHNANRGGIGGGDNAGIQAAVKDGYEHFITMDQDSSFLSPEHFRLYKDNVETLMQNDPRIVSCGPLIHNKNARLSPFAALKSKVLSPLKKRLLGKRYAPSSPEYESKDKLIRSGNIVSAEAWKTCGKFNETLIVSGVDYDFCYRLIKDGHKLVRLNRHVLLQYAGEKRRFTIFPKFLNRYTDTRYYFNIRNAYIMQERHPKHAEYYKNYLRKAYVDFCMNTIHPLKHREIWKKARNDSEKMIAEYRCKTMT